MGHKWTELDQMERSGPNRKNRTEWEQGGPNRTKGTKVNRMNKNAWTN